MCDLLVSLATGPAIAANVFEILQKLWPSTTTTVATQQRNRQPHRRRGQHFGYMHFLCNAVAALRLHAQHRPADQSSNPLSMCALLSDDALVLEPLALADWLQREQAFEMLRRFEAAAVDRPDVLVALQPVFKRVRTPAAAAAAAVNGKPDKTPPPPVVHLFGRACEFLQSAGRLMRFTGLLGASFAPTPTPPTQLLQIDWYRAVGGWLLTDGRKCAPVEVEGLLCEMNMNLVHVLAMELGGESTAGAQPRGIRDNDDDHDCEAVDRILQRIESKPDVDAVHRIPTSYPRSAPVNDAVWSYIGQHNPMLASVLQRLCGAIVEVASGRGDCLERLANLAEVRQTATVLHANCKWAAALAYDFTGVPSVCRAMELGADAG